jgi:hypothetical protein
VIQSVGISYDGDAKRFLDFMAQVDERQCQEVLVSTPKRKGRRELKNLESSINFDSRSVGSSQDRGKMALAVM